MINILAVLWLATGEPSLYGDWSRGDGRAKVRIEPCGADICAVNTWIRPDVKAEKVGDRLVMTIRPDGGDKWVGKAYDPQRHMTFGMTIDVAATTLTTHGCVLGGLVCNTMGWKRL